MPRWLKQFLSYVLSFVLYSCFLDPKVALMIMGAISVHECGHLYAAKACGLKTKGFYLIPFMGGVSLTAERFKRYSQMSLVVLAGPAVGAVFSLAFYGLYLVTKSPFIGESAYWMAILNLFNLLPMAMLDGGQFAESILYSINDLLATVFLTVSYTVAAIVLWFFNPILSVLTIFLGSGTLLGSWRRFNMKRRGMEYLLPPQPERMRIDQILLSLSGYFVIVGLLINIIGLCHTAALQPYLLFRR